MWIFLEGKYGSQKQENTVRWSVADVNGVQRNEELSDDSAIGGMRPGQPHLLQGFQRLLSHLLFQQECCPEKLGNSIVYRNHKVCDG